MNWIQAFESFLRIVEVGSFSQAAKQHYATSSTLSKHMHWLETKLGVQLLARSTRSLAMTEAGEQLYRKSKHILAELQALKQELTAQQAQLSGSLKITASVTFGETALMPVMQAFMRQYPGINIELFLSNRYVDLIEEGFHVAIRSGDIDSKRYQQQRFAAFQVGLFASSRYLAQQPAINCPQDLSQHNCLAHSDFNPPHLWRFHQSNVSIQPKLLSNSVSQLLQAATQGLGILYISEYVVANQLAEKKLQPILAEHWQKPIDHSIIYPRSDFPQKKIQLLQQFITKAFAQKQVHEAEKKP